MSKMLATMPRTRQLQAHRVLAYLLVGLATTSSGCAALSHYQPTKSDLLSDYSGLTKDKFHVNPGLGIQRNYSHNATLEVLGGVDSYYIESIIWVVDKESRAGSDPTRRDVLIAALDEALRKQLNTLGPIVEQPGPRTGRVRAVITDVRLSRPVLNTLLTVGGCFFPLAPLGPTFFGGACVEAEIIGPDNRQIAAISCASGGGTLDIVGFYARSSHAKKAMRRAARELRQTLEP